MRPARCVTLGLLLATLLLTSAPLATAAQGSAELNTAVIRQLYAAYNRGDWAALDPLLAEDVYDYDRAPGQAPGRAGVVQLLQAFHAAFTGPVVLDQLVTTGDEVADRLHLDGTQTGPFLGLPPSGKRVHLEAIEIWVIENGQAVSVWHVENILQLLIQLGAIPSPSGPAATPAAATPMATPAGTPLEATPAATPAEADTAVTVDVVARYYQAVNSGNLAAFDPLIATNAIDHNPSLRTQAPGRAGIRQAITALRAAFPDYHVAEQDTLAEGELVVIRSTATGTQTGPLLGIPPSGKAVQFETMDIWRVENGQITDVWHVEQLLSVLVQIGAVPAPGGAATPLATPAA
jgi:steroid delta-isomerase-like uncharacterized protein